jgi:hypothetical protein
MCPEIEMVEAHARGNVTGMEHMQSTWVASREGPRKSVDEDAHVAAHVIEMPIPVLVFRSLPEPAITAEVNVQPETNFMLATGTVSFTDLSQQRASSQGAHFSDPDIPGPLGRVKIFDVNKQATCLS